MGRRVAVLVGVTLALSACAGSGHRRARGFVPPPIQVKLDPAVVRLLSRDTTARVWEPLPVSVAQSFLARAGGTVAFVDWDRAGSTVSGSLLVTRSKPGAARRVTTERESLVGTVYGGLTGVVTLDLQRPDETWVTASAILTGHGFNLLLPRSATQVTNLNFVSASRAAYRRAVSQLDAGRQ
jgi:hypothetical protein